MRGKEVIIMIFFLLHCKGGDKKYQEIEDKGKEIYEIEEYDEMEKTEEIEKIEDIIKEDMVEDEDSFPLKCNFHSDCEEEEFCDNGKCVPDICVPYSAECKDEKTKIICDEFGSSFFSFNCNEDEECVDEECKKKNICNPGWEGCKDGVFAKCNEEGTKFIKVKTCPQGYVCGNKGKCEPNKGYIYIVFQNAGDMGSYETSIPDKNFGSEVYNDILNNKEGIAPCVFDAWVKEGEGKKGKFYDITQLFQQKFILKKMLQMLKNYDGFYISIWTFPTKEGTPYSQPPGVEYLSCPGVSYAYHCPQMEVTVQNSYIGLGISCAMTGENYTFNSDGVIEINENSEFFVKNIKEIMLLPPTLVSEIDYEEIFKWFDYKETLIETGEECDSSQENFDEICIDGKKKVHENPEADILNGVAYGGMQLFRIGEYIRNFVRVEGKKCEKDEDCKSPHYNCIDGKCHDEARNCRYHDVVYINSRVGGGSFAGEAYNYIYFHSKRFFYGTRCESDNDCLNDAKCKEIIFKGKKIKECIHPSFISLMLENGYADDKDCLLHYDEYIWDSFYPHLFSPNGEKFFVTVHTTLFEVAFWKYPFNIPWIFSPLGAFCGGGKLLDFSHTAKENWKKQLEDLVDLLVKKTSARICDWENNK